MDALNLKAWEGRSATQFGCVGAQQAALIAATLDYPGDALRDGDLLPPLWHWCAFPPTYPTRELKEDGHPPLGDLLPPIQLPRRMWAGGQLEFLAELHVGEPLTKSSTILKVEDKGGSNAAMVFVTVAHELRGAQGVAIRERQTIVYLEIPKLFTPPTKRPMPQDGRTRRVVPMHETTLFRFSAITFNAHRIHYDLDYTCNVEKYPALIIHGPLQAMYLMALATETRAQAPTSFTFRGVHPMFLGDDLDLVAVDAENGGLDLFAGQAGHQGTIAHANWEDTK